MEFEEDFIFKICILGDIGTGKSSLLNRLCNNQFMLMYSSTIGVDFKIYHTYLEDHNVNIKLQIWDTAGQEKFLSIVRTYFRKMSGCIIVYDVTNLRSFNNLEKWIDELYQNCSKIPIIAVAGNKIDLNKQREVESKQLKEWVSKQENDIIYHEISVKNDENINSIFKDLTQQIYEKLVINNNPEDYEEYDIKKTPHKFRIKEKSIKNPQKKCCIIS
jgi:small GTP-binding protein